MKGMLRKTEKVFKNAQDLENEWMNVCKKDGADGGQNLQTFSLEEKVESTNFATLCLFIP